MPDTKMACVFWSKSRNILNVVLGPGECERACILSICLVLAAEHTVQSYQSGTPKRVEVSISIPWAVFVNLDYHKLDRGKGQKGLNSQAMQLKPTIHEQIAWFYLIFCEDAFHICPRANFVAAILWAFSNRVVGYLEAKNYCNQARSSTFCRNSTK